MFRLLLSLLLLVLLTAGVHAQAPAQQCATMQMDSLLRARHPELGTLADFERALQKKMIELKKQMANGRTG